MQLQLRRSESLHVEMARSRFLETKTNLRPYANIPNAITMVGYVSQILWVAGAPWPFAIVGLLADEIDGRVARATNETSEYGGLLDWGVDLTLTGLTAARAGLLWTLPFTTMVQVAMRQRDMRPSCGSARALYTLIALGRGI